MTQEAAHTQDAVIYDPITNQVVMVVIPTGDAGLDDPAFNPPGLVQQRVPHVEDEVNRFDPVAQARAVVAAAQAAKPDVPLKIEFAEAAPVEVAPAQADQP